ncbi:MAG: pyridoxal phosphate-dependent aminotransferase, partial [Acidobacteriota bacterium]|nr:pyridoxal phosphate-dependent aminotransferase [Acidobacteriota bacterium]
AVVSLPGCGGSPACAERLVRERGVVVHPGAFYGMHEPNRAVLSLLPDPEVFAHGLQRMLQPEE